MQSILVVGVIVFTGFLLGEIATKFKLPKVTGYILAGILLNPHFFNLMPQDFVKHTNLVTNISLFFITFSVGGTLLYPRIKKLGRGILCITIFEAKLAFLAVIIGFLTIAPFFVHLPQATWFATFIPLSILLGSLGSPTDPSATLAITQQYKARGEVSSTIMGVAAFDDVLGIINWSSSSATTYSLVAVGFIRLLCAMNRTATSRKTLKFHTINYVKDNSPFVKGELKNCIILMWNFR